MVVFHILIIYICMISLYALKYYKVTIYFSFRFSLGRLDMITFDYYRIFYFVAKYKSFTKAAEVLQNSQPNISRCMGNLEQELECKLFMRSNRGIILTPVQTCFHCLQTPYFRWRGASSGQDFWKGYYYNWC